MVFDVSATMTPYFTSGEVVKGFGRGSKDLGIPTANFPDTVVDGLPENFGTGVYYGWAQVGGSDVHKMVMSIGWNPYYKNTKKSMETHVIHQFKEDFYGSILKVVITGFIRGERDFKSLGYQGVIIFDPPSVPEWNCFCGDGTGIIVNPEQEEIELDFDENESLKWCRNSESDCRIEEFNRSLEAINGRYSGNSRLPTIQVLVSWDIVGLVYECLDLLRLSRNVSDGVASWLHQLIVELGPRDHQFSAKAKKSGVKLSCLVLKNVIFESKNFVPILKTFKLYSRAVGTCRNVLSREQAVTLLAQVLTSDGKRPPLHITLTLETLSNMCKQKALCQEAVKCGVASTAVKILRSWQFVELQEQIKLCRSALSVLNRLASSGIGATPIKRAGGLDVVEKFLDTCPAEPPVYDPLLSKAAELYHYLATKKPLPIQSLRGPFKFADKQAVLSYIEDDSRSSDTARVEESSSGSELDPASEGIETTTRSGSNRQPCFLLVSSSTFQRNSPEIMGFSDFFGEMSIKDLRLVEPLAAPWGSDVISTKKQMILKFREKAGYTVDLGEINLKSERTPVKLSSASTHLHFTKDGKVTPILTHAPQRKASIELTEKPPAESVPINGVLTAERYGEEASKVRSVVPFVKFAFPDFCSDVPCSRPLERLYDKDRTVCREKLVTVVKRMSGEMWKPQVVYDLDTLAKKEFKDFDPEDLTPIRERQLSNDDLSVITKLNASKVVPDKNSLLQFESRFECGNLRRAIQVGPREYDLFVSPDLGTSDHHMWFYFQVSGMLPNVSYTFNIASCKKSNCQFNFGMKPVLFSVAEHVAGTKSGSGYVWERVGTNICYFTNQYADTGKKNSGDSVSGFRSASFTVTFKHANDICYIAYHYPYTYTALRCHLEMWKEKASQSPGVYISRQILCKSEAGNPVPLLTITDLEKSDKRQYCVLTARVHPSEANSSWLMKGVVDYLLSDTPVAKALRKGYVFKIIPMLNIDGVVNGNGRCSLYGEDLNRRWKSPDPTLHPSIYAAKGLLAYLTHQTTMPPFLFCDYHGHARYKNIFIYGCSPTLSWNKSDVNTMARDSLEYQGFPLAMQHLCPSFSLEKCDFTVARDREATARVTVWREFNIPRSYTLESTYCGCAEGPYRGYHIGIRELKESGAKFCEAIYCLDDKGKPRLHLRPGVDRRLPAIQQENGPECVWEELASPIDIGSSSSSASSDSESSEAEDGA
ncbi:unnamed protein product [Notodromas monacha]|uniref:Peptidase M14 domain-containing protein n=1 Tax=Notodromas monacha TaxID=399045 RepID=A0A7R9BG51_9CRUS|nr:unnamed protein product [Notodromas monacha]CAG0914004.1 unnamed protein product [Notodromas monacha]